jgi:hypothetical protein
MHLISSPINHFRTNFAHLLRPPAVRGKTGRALVSDQDGQDQFMIWLFKTVFCNSSFQNCYRSKRWWDDDLDFTSPRVWTGTFRHGVKADVRRCLRWSWSSTSGHFSSNLVSWNYDFGHIRYTSSMIFRIASHFGEIMIEVIIPRNQVRAEVLWPSAHWDNNDEVIVKVARGECLALRVRVASFNHVSLNEPGRYPNGRNLCVVRCWFWTIRIRENSHIWMQKRILLLAYSEPIHRPHEQG